MAIKSSDHVFVSADKTTNVYKVTPDRYKQLLTENITTKYKTSSPSVKRKIDTEAKKIATSYKLADRIERMAEREAFVTLKDHKENFERTLKCRLLNPAKSEIGSISKSILQNINSEIRKQTQLNQWRNTATVIEWF